MLKCPYCGAETPIPQSDARVEELDFRAHLKELSTRAESYEPQVIKCNACGAEVTVPAEVAAGACPFCGSPYVIAAHKQRLIKPRSLLPFAVTRGQARQLYLTWLGSLWFAPSKLKHSAETNGGIVGVYVPYWTYDCDTTTSYSGQRGDDYYVTEHYTVHVNGKAERRSRQVRKTRWTSVSGVVRNRFDDVLILASQTLPREYTENLEPWDLGNLVPYADDYLSGFRAESYQIDLSGGFAIVQQVIDDPIRASIRQDIGGDHQQIDDLQTRYGAITFKHLLLPVWVSAYRFRDRVYRFVVNGRTGEVQGDRPWSGWKIAAAVIAVAIAVLLIVLIVMMTQSR
jgi:predicted RNA-binding Zn-ribbon protein involved in translation (DUF1610 family)